MKDYERFYLAVENRDERQMASILRAALKISGKSPQICDATFVNDVVWSIAPMYYNDPDRQDLFAAVAARVRGEVRG